MERHTNSYEKLINQVRHELHSFELKDEEYVMIEYTRFLPFPSIPGGYFSIAIIEAPGKEQLKLVKQSWDFKYDFNRFRYEIYNLDRLRIQKHLINLSQKKQAELAGILNSLIPFPGTLDVQNQVMIDGIDYQLIFNTPNLNQKYEWRTASERTRLFNPLIDFLLKATTESSS